MDDKFLRDRIRDDEVDVPESLLPENISKKLDAGADNTKKQGVKTLSRNIRGFALAAAAVIVVAAGASMVSRLSPKNTSGSNEDMYEYEKMLETTDDADVQQKQYTQQKRVYPDEEGVQKILPKIQGQTIPYDSIYLPDEKCQGGVLIASFDVDAPGTVCDQKLIFSGYAMLSNTFMCGHTA